MKIRFLTSTLVLLISAATLSYGQTSLATITGTVVDATGAVIASAPVEVKNQQTGQVFRTASTDSGNYSVQQLPIGDYDLNVTVTGFKAYTHTGFHLAAGQTMREDVTLEIGNTTESVTVTADASLLKTESSELVQNVTLSQLNNLPILTLAATNSGVRDPFAAAKLAPGISYCNATTTTANCSAVTQLVVNGTPANTYQTRLDGMTINPTGPRLLGAQMETQPSTDAIQEVAMQTSNFAAEYGTAGGAMINMVTKSGTNSFHGSVYDYATNEALNAHQPYTGLRNKLRQHDWGFTFGGPLRIPGVYDGKNKTFFFWSYEQFRQNNIVTTAPGTVPTDAYRAGDFSNLLTVENRFVTTANGIATDALGRQIRSGTIYDPLTQALASNGVAYRDPFVGNQIPVSRFDPISAKVLALVPKPQGTNFASGQLVNNYQAPYDGSRRSGIPSIKIDQNIGSKMRLSFYHQYTHTATPRTITGADSLPNNITASAISANDGMTDRLNFDYTVTPRMILHLGAGFNTSDFRLTEEAAFDQIALLGLKGATEPTYFPQIQTGVSTNNAIGGMGNLGTPFPTQSFERRPTGNASVSYVVGSHTFKFGAEWRQERFPNYVRANTNGIFTFGANYTQTPSLQGSTINNGFNGFGLASFLLGGMSSNQLGAPIALRNQKSQSAIYAQDTWKVTRKITLDYGLRWDYGTYPREQYGRNGSIALALPNPSASGRLGAQQFEATCGCKFASNYPFAVGPRLGLAYQIDSKTVLRAGFGVVYNATNNNAGTPSAQANSLTLPANSGQITGLFQNGMPSAVQAVWPSFAPNVNQALGAAVAMPNFTDPNAGRPARLWQWNIGLQREINRNLVVEASYVGNRGVWWTASGLAPLNALSQGTLNAAGFTDFTSASDSALLTATVGGLTPAQRSVLASRGITGFPYSSYLPTQGVRQSLLDYPQYTGSGLNAAPLGKTWYDGLQVSATQRFSHGISANVNYTGSKNLSLLSSPDVFNRNLGKNLSTSDIPHVLRLTVQYQVPVLKSSGVPFVSNRIVSEVLSGWGIGAFLQYQSAGLVGLPASAGSLPINNFLGRGPGPAQLKTNPDGSYMSPWSVDWTDYSGTHHTDPLDINCHCFDPAKTVVLNPAAFTNVPNGQFGANQSSIRSFRGQRQPVENMNFSRNFRIKEGIALNVRVEFSNVFNRMQFPNITPSSALTPTVLPNFATAATRFTSGPNTGLISGGYGSILVTNGLIGQRAGSLVARLTF